MSVDFVQSLYNWRSAAIKRYNEFLIYHIDKVIFAIKYTSGIRKNQSAVNKLKSHISQYINDFVSLYQVRDEPLCERPFYNILNYHLSCEIQGLNYIVSKIGSYLTEEVYGPNYYNFDADMRYDVNTFSNVEWGFQQFKKFKSLLSDKYLEIDYDMPFREIQLLVRTALFIFLSTNKKLMSHHLN